MPLNTYYDNGYNTRLGVENEDQIFVDWNAASEAARRDLTCHIGVAYGAADRETVDLFPAANDTGRWLVFIHGGYWRMGTTEMFSFIVPPFVEAGLNVALVEYALTPHVTIGTIVEQVRRGIAWLH
ncbi:MAG: alpha/beta hydrolase, partial [Chloroflexota bacterium]